MKRFSCWSLTGMILLLFFPYWTDYMFVKEETLYYLLRVEEFAGEWDRGGVLLRIPVLFRHLGLNVMTTHKLCVLLMIVTGMLLAYAGFRAFFKEEKTALLATLLYHLSPFSIHLLYDKCALGTYLVYLLVPALLGGARMLWDRWQGILLLSLGLVGLLLSFGFGPGDGAGSLKGFAGNVFLGIGLFALTWGLVRLVVYYCDHFCEGEEHKKIMPFVVALVIILPAFYLMNQLLFVSDAYYLKDAGDCFALREVGMELAVAGGEKVWTLRAILKLLALILLQFATLGGCILMFRELFPGEKVTGFFGTLLYMTLPARIKESVEEGDLAKALIWMLLPFALWALGCLLNGRKKERKTSGKMILVALITLVGSLGGLAFLVLRILHRSVDTTLSVMEQGYSVGGFFSAFVYRDNKPGMGVVLALGLLAAGWLLLVKRKNDFGKISGIYTLLGVVLTVMSLRYFPWDLLGRVHPGIYTRLSAMGGAAIFFYLAQIAFCVPAAKAFERLGSQEDEELGRNLRIFATLAGVGFCAFRIYNL